MSQKINKARDRAKWFFLIMLICTGLAEQGISQGLGCKDLQFILVPQSGNCCYKLGVNNKSVDNCFQQVNLNVNPEVFINFNAIAGWRANEVTQREYNVRPLGAFIPFGYSDIATFCIQGNPSSSMIVQWDHLCLIKGCDTTIAINGCQPIGHIEGYVYADIGCEGKTYTGIAGLVDWTVEVYDNNGDLLATELTDLNGYYKFYDLPLGNYIVRLTNQPGWTPKIPISGEYNTLVEEDKTSRADFGNCPVCPCDSLNFNVQFVEHGDDSISYYISLNHHLEPCRYRSKFIEIRVDSGTLYEYHPINNDICCNETNKACCHWSAARRPNSQTLLLSHDSGLLPASDQFILKFSIRGKEKHKFIIDLLNKIDSIGDCERSFVYTLPIFSRKNCCPANSFQGPELICNGEFNVTSPGSGFCISSDYNYYTGPAIGAGSFTVGNWAAVSAANGGNWVCMGLTGPADNFMIIDGGSSNQRIWEQTIPVVQNSEYQFSINMNCIDRVNPGKDPQIDIFFNNQLINTLIAPYNSGWKNLNFCWNSRDKNQLSITIKTNHNIGSNDFALDGISLKSCIPDSLCCDPSNFTSITYSLNGDHPNFLFCGDTLKSDCKTTTSLSISGYFSCVNMNCKPQLMTAELTKPDGSTVSVSLNWPMPNFNINILGADLSVSGFYHLSILAVCGNSVCRCDFVICVECCLETFDNDAVGSKSQWLGIKAGVAVLNSSPPNLTNVLRGLDGQGASWMYNTQEYSGNWINKFNGCLCFDIRYDPGTTSNPPKGDRTLYIYNGITPLASTLRAVFVSNKMIGNSWERICAPIALSGTSLPSNSYGSWQMSLGSNSSFNSLISNVGGIGFAVDFAGGGSPDELLYLDNICLEKCLDSCYCGPHKISYSIGRGPLLEKKCGDTLFVPSAGTVLPIKILTEFSCLGERCDTPKIDWELTGPSNFIPIHQSGIVPDPIYNLPLSNSTFVFSGIYTLTINGHCGNNTCPCKIYFYAEGFDCCKDSVESQALASSFVDTESDGANCKIKLSLGNVPECMKITTINWGDGTVENGLYSTGDMLMHNYSNSGIYTVSWTVTEFESGRVCRVFIFRKTINLKCECDCRGLEWAEYYHVNSQPSGIGCNNTTPITIGCQKFGPSFLIHGDLNCSKNTCKTDTFYWELYEQGQFPAILLDSDINFYPHFDIIIPWSYFKQGNYTLKVFRYCNGLKCECNFNIFAEQCPCSCDLFTQDIAKAFNVGSGKQNCQKIFKPVGLCDQDKVNWTINSQLIPGSSIGNNDFIHTFTSNGTYQVCMAVNRTDAFGNNCNDTICRKIYIKCNPLDGYNCSQDKIRNGNFGSRVSGNPVFEIGHREEGIENWGIFNNPGSLGLVIVYEEPGGFDEGAITMIGNQSNFSGIVQLAPVIEANLQAQRYKMSIGYNFINYLDNDPNEPELEFRLQKSKDHKDASDKVVFVKRKDMREDLEGKRNTWMLVDTSIVVEGLDPNTIYYLVICLRNKSMKDFSFIGLDNIQVCVEELDATNNANKPQFDAIIQPNPVDELLKINWNSESTRVIKMEIINVHGQFMETVHVKRGNYSEQLNISNYPDGMYFLKIHGVHGLLKCLNFVKQ